ncbi:hypothetical protein FHU33_0526 [Blastococcus colisei]|uniref:Uncharacterized protein n=1 Tax=Blastococcus colisei TaxID=1564162 RepID=A0A543PAS2_9ACTN|nr:hypothetical protein [Blastococcus colisei]TQN41166.1 hypothetical protein FHU33_0526 [Blastococcus colisei]
MRPARRSLPVLLASLGVLLLPGCVQLGTLSTELVACKEGDDGMPSNGVVLMAQSVPSASWVPCLEGMPLGWHFSDMDVDRGSARFWLDSDRDGTHAIEVRLTESCDTEGATEIPSDRPEMRRLERVTQVSPQYVGRRYYLFEGGCITVLFTLFGENRGEPLAVATQGLGAVPRDELRALVHEKSGGRLYLDPPATRDGGR